MNDDSNIKFRYPVTPRVEVILDDSLTICLRTTGTHAGERLTFTISNTDDLIMGLKAARAQREVIENRQRKPAEQTWTFFGHWENDRIVVEYTMPGSVEDLREDTGYWPEGLWADSGTGATRDEAQAATVAEYENDLRGGDDED